jgi:hypothetical protein
MRIIALSHKKNILKHLNINPETDDIDDFDC